MANINVNYAELQTTANLIATGRDTIFSELDRLKGKIDELVSSGFITDTASKTFQTSYHRFTSGARTTIQGLDEVIRFLRAAEQTLRDTDSRMAQALGGA
jgi:WXG100 family type VII secretion target